MRSTNPMVFLLLWGIMTRYLARMDFKACFPPSRNRLIIYYILVEKSDSENCWKCHFYVFSSHFKQFVEKMYFLMQLYDSKWALLRIKRDWYDNWEVKQCPSDTKLSLWRISDIPGHFNAMPILSIGKPKPMTQLSRYGIPYFLRFIWVSLRNQTSTCEVLEQKHNNLIWYCLN